MNNNPYFQPTNYKIFVANVDDAISRFAAPNTIIPYFTQDEKGLIEVYTDFQGRKNIREFQLLPVQKPKQTGDYITREEFNNLITKLDNLTTKKKAVKENELEQQ